MTLDLVANGSSLRCQRDAKTNTVISNEMVEFDTGHSLGKLVPAADDTVPSLEVVVVTVEVDQEADLEATDLAAILHEINVVHFTTNLLTENMVLRKRLNGQLKWIIYRHDAVGKT